MLPCLRKSGMTQLLRENNQELAGQVAEITATDLQSDGGRPLKKTDMKPFMDTFVATV